jgi:aryl-phospho-beta-D-glucosidase BglC (GH1 family)
MDQHAFHVGVNLGGWISQYPAYDPAYFRKFITAADIHRIADWGCDHVRLPVDYPVLECEHEPVNVNEEGLELVYQALQWCRDNQLNVILDLHKAPGFVFDNFQAATLFNDLDQQERFINLWERMAVTFHGNSDYVAFELLNEIVLPNSVPWNSLAEKTVSHIRKIDPDRLLVLGGNYYNAASQLENLVILDDPNILYTFHFYEPMIVTHQKAGWVPGLKDYNGAIDYPGLAPNLFDSLQERSDSLAYFNRRAGQYLDRNTLISDVQPAVDFSRRHKKTVYCGEFGVIDAAPLSARMNWTRDLISILEEQKIGRAYWSYKGYDFGLVDPEGKVVNEELVKIVCAQ